MEANALRALGTLFDALSIRWVLIGAVAANRYRSSPRSTLDLDFLLDLSRSSIVGLEDALRKSGWHIRRGDAAGELLRIRHPLHGLADLIIAGTDYQVGAIDRARIEQLAGDVTVHVLTPEDVIVHKLIAGRGQDLADIEAILLARLPLDQHYIERWAEFWEVTARWQGLNAEE